MVGKQLIFDKKIQKDRLIKYYNLKFWNIKSKIEPIPYLKDNKFDLPLLIIYYY